MFISASASAPLATLLKVAGPHLMIFFLREQTNCKRHTFSQIFNPMESNRYLIYINNYVKRFRARSNIGCSTFMNNATNGLHIFTRHCALCICAVTASSFCLFFVRPTLTSHNSIVVCWLALQFRVPLHYFIFFLCNFTCICIFFTTGLSWRLKPSELTRHLF